MTRATNARVAGAAFLLYIAVGVSQLILFGGTSAGEGATAGLESMGQHATEVRIDIVLGLFTCFLALTLAVTLWALTREEDPDLAMLGLTCRVGEGVVGAVSMPLKLGLLSLATAAGPDMQDPATANAIGSVVLAAGSFNPIFAATFFAVGSALFSWLLLRGRMIPVALGWLGVLASLVLVAGLPLRLAGVLQGPITTLMWIPMAAFEIPLGLWLIIKGGGMPANK